MAEYYDHPNLGRVKRYVSPTFERLVITGKGWEVNEEANGDFTVYINGIDDPVGSAIDERGSMRMVEAYFEDKAERTKKKPAKKAAKKSTKKAAKKSTKKKPKKRKKAKKRGGLLGWLFD